MTDQRDERLERTLRTVLRPTGGRSTASCLDAETLAAWADGGLSEDDATAAEAHAATCERCQAILAAMVRSEPAAERSPVLQPSNRRWMRWAIPTAAAAVIALAIWLPGANDEPRPESTSASAPAAQSDARIPAAEPQIAAPSSSTVSPDTPPPSGRERQRAADPQQPAESGARVEAPATKAAEPASIPPAPPGPTSPLAETITVAPSRPANLDALDQVVVADFSSAGVNVPSQTPPVDRRDDAAALTERRSPDAAARSAPGAPRGAAGQAALEAVSPPGPPVRDIDAPIRWRVLGSGAVLRSTTGADWETVPLPDAFVTHGTAPLPQVCWLVGRAGSVFLTTDGTRFTRLPFPEAVDLASVRATNALVASVTATDGRTFRTTDGGQTWRLN